MNSTTDNIQLDASTTLFITAAAAAVLYFLYRRSKRDPNKDGVFIGRNAPGFQTAGIRKMQVTPEEYRRLTGREPPVARPDLQHLRAGDSMHTSGSGDESAASDSNDSPRTRAKAYDEDWLPEGTGARSKAKSKARKRG